MHKNHLENLDSKKFLFVNTFTSMLLIVSITFIFYHFIFNGYYLDSAWPENSFFQKPEIFGNDFSRMMDVSSSLDPYGNMRRVFLNEANPLMPCLLTYFMPVMSYQYKLITLFIPIYYFIDNIKYESLNSIKQYGIIFGLALSAAYINQEFQHLFLKSILILTYALLIYNRLEESDLSKSKISYLKKIFVKKWK